MSEPVFQEGHSPPTPDSALIHFVFFPSLWFMSPIPDVPISFPVRFKWEGHLHRQMGMPIEEGVGKVIRNEQEKLDSRTSPLAGIEGLFSALEFLCMGGVGSSVALMLVPPTCLLRWQWPHWPSWLVNYARGWPTRMRSHTGQLRFNFTKPCVRLSPKPN